MAEPILANSLGEITGLVGMVTGVAGAVMGYVGYRRSVKVKALDLRLELRKAENDLRFTAGALSALLESAKGSHVRVSAAIGLANSGAMQVWNSEWDSELPVSEADYSGPSDTVLEAKLIEVHALYLDAAALRDKYRGIITADDKRREEIRADVRARPL